MVVEKCKTRYSHNTEESSSRIVANGSRNNLTVRGQKQGIT